MKQFCKHNHDTYICGRDSQNKCKDCRKNRSKLVYISHFRLSNKFCKRGHDVTICGRYKDYKCKLCANEYYLTNKKSILKQKLRRDNNRLKTDVIFKLKSRLRIRIYQALKGNYKAGFASKNLGCSIPELKQYIESKFYAGMTWDNWGKIWELDHVKELREFDLADPIQLKEAIYYTNLQPLTVEDHKKKTFYEK